MALVAEKAVAIVGPLYSFVHVGKLYTPDEAAVNQQPWPADGVSDLVPMCVFNNILLTVDEGSVALENVKVTVDLEGETKPSSRIS